MDGIRPLCWGIIGAGAIVDRWIKGAKQCEDMAVKAIAARRVSQAREKAAEWDIPEATDIGSLLADGGIDAVYIAVPHAVHREMTLRALRAGKHVLVEKPGGISAAEFEEMAAEARARGLFLMEAVWTRFFPCVEALRRELAEGTVGEVRMLRSAFAYRIEDDDTTWITRPESAGGGLMDVGVYNLHFARMMLDADPVDIVGTAARDTDDMHLQVDEQAAYIARYANGALAVMASGIRVELTDEAVIYGSKGMITVPRFWSPDSYTVSVGGSERTERFPVEQRLPGIADEGYQYEMRHVCRCIREGLAESPVMPHETTLAVLRLCDRLRSQWNA